MILHDYLRVLRRGWWVIAALVVLGAAGGAVASYLTPPTYSARATVYVATIGNATPGDLQQGNVFTMQRVATYADLAVTSAVLSRAASAIGDGTVSSDLNDSITSSARAETGLIDIDATGGDPAEVAERANAVATALAAEVPRLDTPGTDTPVELTVVEQAVQPDVAITPQPRNNFLIGALVGLVLGLGIVVVAHALDTRIRSLGDFPRIPGLATVTSLPGPRARPTKGVSPGAARTESFRNLRANLQFGTSAGSTIAVAGVTSVGDPAAVASQLAGALGEIGSDVVLVDVDLSAVSRSSRGRRNAAVEQRPGVADVLRGSASISDVIVKGEAENLYFVGAGLADDLSAQLLSTPAMRGLLAELSARFSYVILSSPPLVERSDSAVAAALADSSLVVVESGATTRDQLMFAVELLRGVRVESISVALDHVRDLDMSSRTITASEIA